MYSIYLEAVDVDDSRGDLYVEHGEHRGGRLARELGVEPRVQPRAVVALDHRAQGGAEERVRLGVLREKKIRKRNKRNGVNVNVCVRT